MNKIRKITWLQNTHTFIIENTITTIWTSRQCKQRFRSDVLATKGFIMSSIF